MFNIDISLLSFLFGESAVVASRLIAQSFGGRLGGILQLSGTMAAAEIMAGHFGNSWQHKILPLKPVNGFWAVLSACLWLLIMWNKRKRKGSSREKAI